MARGSGSYFRFKWYGANVIKQLGDATEAAVTEIGELWVEESQKELYPGHGYITGRLHDSIYYRLNRTATRVYLYVGSDVPYAIWVHQGHRSFPGYHFITIGLERTKPMIPMIIWSHKIK